MICRADTRAGVPGEVLQTGRGLRGEPVAVRRGQVAAVHLYHAAACPGGRGRPDLCRCKPEARLEVLAGKGTP